MSCNQWETKWLLFRCEWVLYGNIVCTKWMLQCGCSLFHSNKMCSLLNLPAENDMTPLHFEPSKWL